MNVPLPVLEDDEDTGVAEPPDDPMSLGAEVWEHFVLRNPLKTHAAQQATATTPDVSPSRLAHAREQPGQIAAAPAEKPSGFPTLQSMSVSRRLCHTRRGKRALSQVMQIVNKGV